MARTTTNGYIVPEDGDAGNTWADALEFDIDKVDALETTVNTLDIGSITRLTQTILAANWAVDAGGRGFRQAVSMPSGAAFNTNGLQFRVTSGAKANHIIYPTIEATSLTTYELVVNDSTLELEVLYT